MRFVVVVSPFIDITPKSLDQGFSSAYIILICIVLLFPLAPWVKSVPKRSKFLHTTAREGMADEWRQIFDSGAS